MKLNVKDMRYLAPEDWRVLTAAEQGSRNHELVPTPLIIQLSSLRSPSTVHESIKRLAKTNLLAKIKNAKYDGYRLTYGGLDYLALHSHTKANTIYSVGNEIGVGKESDINVCADETGRQQVLKIHRLGRISFRTVKANRDYLRNRSSASWMYMSRLAALKEFEFMKALRREGFPVPEPLGQNRHTVVMSLVDAFPMRQISAVGKEAAAGLYAELLSLIVRLAQYGLIHGDFNEFNILVEEKEIKPESESESEILLTPTIIDFPQMVSIDHGNAEYYFDRDVSCIKRFFQRRFGFTSDEPGPFFKESIKTITKRIDVEVEASGFSKKMAKELDAYMKEHNINGDAEDVEAREDGEDAAIEAEDDVETKVTQSEEVPPMDTEAGERSEPKESNSPAQPHDLNSSSNSTNPTPSSTLPSTIASEMTLLSLANTDPLPTLEEVKPPQPTMTTKAAKAKAGWAI